MAFGVVSMAPDGHPCLRRHATREEIAVDTHTSETPKTARRPNKVARSRKAVPSLDADERQSKFSPPPTRAMAAADEIRKRILDGRYVGGMQLRQDALAEEFGVSRIPVREALVQLEAEGLLKINPHRGATVTEFSVESVEELFTFRSLIEPYLLVCSAPKLVEAEYAALDAVLVEYSNEMRSMNVALWGELNIRYHSLLYKHAGSPKIEATALQLLQGTDRFTRMQLYYTDGRARAEQDHDRIVRRCKERDFSGAAEELRSHIVGAGAALSTLLRERQQG